VGSSTRISQTTELVAYRVTAVEINGSTSAGLTLKSNSGATVAAFGAGGGQSVAFSDGGSFAGRLAVNGESHSGAALEVRASDSSGLFHGHDVSGNEVFVISSNGTTKIGTVNNTTFEPNGFMVATGSAIAWKDIFIVPIISAKATGAGALTLTTITGNIQAYALADGDSVMINNELNHEWKIGTPIGVHLHILGMTNVAAPRYVKYVLEYSFADYNGQVSGPQIASVNFEIPTSSVVGKHLIVDFGDILPPLTMVSGMFMAKLSRVTATGTAPAADPIALNLGAHGQVDSLGSRTEYTK
jgi:hypothetical protein